MTELPLALTVDRLRVSAGRTDNCALRRARESGRKWAEEVADYSALARLALLVETRNYLSELMQFKGTPTGPQESDHESDDDAGPMRLGCAGKPVEPETGLCTCLEEPIKPMMAAFVDGALDVWQEVKDKI